MPRVYISKSSKPYKRYHPSILKNAIEAYVTGNKSLLEVAKQFNIPKSVLHRHVTRNMKSQGGQRSLSEETEKYIIKFINTCSEWGYPLDSYCLRIIIKGYLDRHGIVIKKFRNNLPGVDFVESFLKRYKNEISQKIRQNIKRSRSEVSPQVIENYLRALENHLEGVPLTNIQNYDESNLADDLGKKNNTQSSTTLLGTASFNAMVAPELKQIAEADSEISKTCAVVGCEDYKELNSDSFFRFPEDPNLRQIWADLTGRNDWTPTDYSYICVQHFSVDCFGCDADNQVILLSKAVPSLKLPNHVLEVQYIDEETLDNEDEEYEMELEEDEDFIINKKENGQITDGGSIPNRTGKIGSEEHNIQLLKLFTEVQRMQRQTIGLKDKLKHSMAAYKKQNKFLVRLKKAIEMKKDILNQKRKKKARILLSLQDKIKEDTNGLVLAMPSRHTDDLKNFALSIYKYSPQAYIYVRNTLRTMLPSTDVLESWLNSGYEPKNMMTASNVIKVVAEQTDTEMLCRVSLV